MNIAGRVAELAGSMPLVRLNRLTRGIDGSVCTKPEFCNPADRVGERIAVALIDQAQASADLCRQTVVIVPSLGGHCLTTPLHVHFSG
jgi:cysteine synthase